MSGRLTTPLAGCYAASKHALEAVTDALRVELGIYGIEVVAIEPGPIRTPIWAKAQPDPRYRDDDDHRYGHKRKKRESFLGELFDF